MSNFCFGSISLEQIYRISPKLNMYLSWLGLLPVIFFQVCNRIMALDGYQNFIFTQYLENKWMESNILHLQDLGWDCKLPCHFLKFVTESWPLIDGF